MEKRSTILFRILLFTTIYAFVSMAVLEISDEILAIKEVTSPLLSQIVAQFCAGVILICLMKKFPLSVKKEKMFQMRRQTQQLISWILICVCASIALNELLALPGLQNMLPGRQAAEQIYADSFIVVFVNAVIASPLAEEVFYRGVLYRGIRCLTGPWTAAIVSAALFGLFHMNVIQGLFAGLMGLLFAAALEESGMFIVPFFAHMLVNLIGVLMTQVGWAQYYGSEPEAAFAGAACAAVCFILMIGKKIQVKRKI